MKGMLLILALLLVLCLVVDIIGVNKAMTGSQQGTCDRNKVDHIGLFGVPINECTTRAVNSILGYTDSKQGTCNRDKIDHIGLLGVPIDECTARAVDSILGY